MNQGEIRMLPGIILLRFWFHLLHSLKAFSDPIIWFSIYLNVDFVSFFLAMKIENSFGFYNMLYNINPGIKKEMKSPSLSTIPATIFRNKKDYPLKKIPLGGYSFFIVS